MFNTRPLLGSALAASLSIFLHAGQPALASAVGSDTDFVTRQVSTADLDLTAPRDQARLRHRIWVAANHVCLDLMVGESTLSDRFADCVREARANAWTDARTAIAAAEVRTFVAAAK
jgi:UrcA family protein